MMAWMILAIVGMLSTVVTAYFSKAFPKYHHVGYYIEWGLCAFSLHVGLIALLKNYKNSPSYSRAWGRVVQGGLFVGCLYLSGIPNLVLITDIRNVWPICGLIAWGLGLEMAIDSKTGGNIFNLTLCVSNSVGIALLSKGNHETLGVVMAFVVPFLCTVLYQFLTPTTYHPPLVELLLDSNNEVDQEVSYKFIKTNFQTLAPHRLVGIISAEPTLAGQQDMVTYKLVPQDSMTRFKRKFRLNDLQDLSAWEILRNWFLGLFRAN